MRAGRGFTLIELLLGMTILVVGLLGIVGMFSTGYTNVAEGGRLTMALAGAQQMLEDLRTLPFDTLGTLHGFDTTNAGSQPAAAPARDLARKWRYALAGDGPGWAFTAVEQQRWARLSSGGAPFAGQGTLSVVAQSATLRRVTVTVPVPGRGLTVQLTTLFSRL
jgi:prepilin-type N-terminal cleavage/methylation domain-containing protein